ncbi:unnamed protein product [marine sediment metagenome]|uniref:Uncharacterized protein n=1 Tax=marine sediment metagenome TaxID=412755 RepID=X1GFX2_9ZZZZ
MKKSKKDKMWVACCGCGKAVNIPETTIWFQDLKTWISVCPFCGFKHKIQITKE